MAFGQEIRLKIGGDSSALEGTFAKAERAAEAAGRRMERSFTRARSALRRDPGNRFDEGQVAKAERAERQQQFELAKKIQQTRGKAAFEEANTVGKIKMVQKELVDLAARKKLQEEGGVAALRLQYDIEKKRVQLRQLQRQAQRERTDQVPMPDGAGGGGFMQQLPRLLIRGIGTAISFGLERAINWQQSRVRVTDTQGQASADAVQSMRARFAAIGGMAGQLRQGKGSLKDLEREQQFYKERASFLSTGMQGAVSLFAPEELTKAEEMVAKIGAQIQQQHDQNALIERDMTLQLRLFAEEVDYIKQINQLRREQWLNDKNRLSAQQTRSGMRELWEGKYGTPEGVRAAQLEQMQLRSDEMDASAAMRSRQAEVNRQFAEQASEGRTFRNGRQRPRSETERIAQRAAMFRQRARDLALSGGSGQEGGRMLRTAARDESRVGQRLSDATRGAGAPPGTTDASSLKPDLARANTLLEAIKNSLAIIDVGN